MARVSKYIGSSYYPLFCEMGLEIRIVEDIRNQNLGNSRTTIIQLLKAWTDKYYEKASIETLLTAMKMNDMAYNDVIRCLNENHASSANGKHKAVVNCSKTYFPPIT